MIGCASALYVALFIAWVVIRPASPPVVTAVDNLAQLIAVLWGLMLCCWGGRWPLRRGTNAPDVPSDVQRAARWVPLLVCLGMVCDTLADIIGMYYNALLRQPQPVPSWADALGLGAYLFYLVATFLLPCRTHARTSRARMALDSLIAVIVAATCSWYFILGPTLLRGHDPLSAKIIAGAYPFCDLLLITALLLLWARGDDPAPWPVMLLFTLAIGSIVVSDSAFDYQTLHGGYIWGTATDAGWVVGSLLGGLGAYALRAYLHGMAAAERAGYDEDAATIARQQSAPSLRRSVLPYVPVPVAGLLMLYAWRTHADGRLTAGVVLGGVLVVGVVILRQVTALLDNTRLYRDLQESEQRYRSLFTRHPDAVFSIDAAGRFTSVNAACQRISGYPIAELLALPSFAPLVAPDHMEQAWTTFTQTIGGAPGHAEVAINRKDEQRVELDVTTIPIITGGAVRGVYGIARDVTAHKEAQSALHYQALHDALTGLPNRTLLMDRLGQAIPSARREGRPLALLLLDLDRFKEVNDTFGHRHGDLLLQQVAARLQHALRTGDTVARLGGDEFAVLLPGEDRTGATSAAEKIAAALNAPCIVDGQHLQVGASIGIALSPEHGLDSETLLRHADVAMYLAKRAGTTCAVYAAEQDEYCPERLTLITDLRQAIARKELVLHYQPKVDVATGRVTSVEALVRWSHPTRGLIAPNQFISLAEHTGLIAPLTGRVLEMALSQCHAWYRRGLQLGVAVNLSMANLRDPRLVDMILELLHRYRVHPSALRLELTESTVMADTTRSLEVLSRLAERGVHISIDDFGTGYSSLAYLKRLPVDELKIDMSFVRHMAEDETDAAIVASTIELGHSLGLQVVAEGVENQETWSRLAALGCDVAQGYYLSKPLMAEALERLLNEAPWAAA